VTLTPSSPRAIIRKAARDARLPAAHEGKVATAPGDDGRCYVTCRSLTGDNTRLGPFHIDNHVELNDGGDLVIVMPTRGDRCWILLDQSGDPACIAKWEPA
jgi:hypothetical protein